MFFGLLEGAHVELEVVGVGAWCERAASWHALAGNLRRDQLDSDEPSPNAHFAELIPARERRRAPLHVKIAVEVAGQAVSAAGVDAANVPSVFASGMADVKTTDTICRALAQQSKIVSPTNFHNSVHNAASGYWSIAATCREKSSAVSGFKHSAGTALLEAAVLCVTEMVPVLLVCSDIATEPPLDAICPVGGAFAAALVLRSPIRCGRPDLRLDVRSGCEHDAVDRGDALALGVAGNPSAAILPLLKRLAGNGPGQVNLNLGQNSSLVVEVLRTAPSARSESE